MALLKASETASAKSPAASLSTPRSAQARSRAWRTTRMSSSRAERLRRWVVGAASASGGGPTTEKPSGGVNAGCCDCVHIPPLQVGAGDRLLPVLRDGFSAPGRRRCRPEYGLHL